MIDEALADLITGDFPNQHQQGILDDMTKVVAIALGSEYSKYKVLMEQFDPTKESLYRSLRAYVNSMRFRISHHLLGNTIPPHIKMPV